MSVHISDLQRDDLRVVLSGARKEAQAFEALTEEIEENERTITVIDESLSKFRKEIRGYTIMFVVSAVLFVLVFTIRFIYDGTSPSDFLTNRSWLIMIGFIFGGIVVLRLF